MKQFKLTFVLTMLMSMVGLKAFADWEHTKTKVDGLYYWLDDDNNQAWVENNPSGEYMGDIIIPSSFTYNGINYSVVGIEEAAFAYCSGLTSITIPNSVTSIGGSSFFGCSGLESVTLNSNAIVSGNYIPFDDEINLNLFFGNQVRKYIIGKDVESIGENAFSGCTSVKRVVLNSNAVVSKPYNALYNMKSIFGDQVEVYVIGDDVTSIGDSIFYGCSDVYEVVIPKSVSSIGSGAFSCCSSLRYVSMPNVTSIGTGAFSGCPILEDPGFPNVTSIGSRAFQNCSRLWHVFIPNSVTSIGAGAFSGCSGITYMRVKSENTVYDSRENCSAIIETASNTLVFGCQTTVIPSSVTSIGESAFSGCSGLTSITIPNSVTSIGDGAFQRCYGLTSITIPNSVKSIGEFAFSDCSGLTSITIGDSVTSIDDWAFNSCYNLVSVTVLNPTPVEISNNVFSNRKNATLYVPIGSKEAYLGAEYWKGFKKIIEKDFTGIDQIMIDGQNNAKIFTLDGKRINKPRKGINIIGGKKVLVK